jgi:hypothetical protein
METFLLSLSALLIVLAGLWLVGIYRLMDHALRQPHAGRAVEPDREAIRRLQAAADQWLTTTGDPAITVDERTRADELLSESLADATTPPEGERSLTGLVDRLRQDYRPAAYLVVAAFLFALLALAADGISLEVGGD